MVIWWVLNMGKGVIIVSCTLCKLQSDLAVEKRLVNSFPDVDKFGLSVSVPMICGSI
jgi:hypothetical protein